MRKLTTMTDSWAATNLPFGTIENLEARIVLDGDWSAGGGASVFGSWGEGGYLTVTTIDLNNEPIVFERTPGSSGSGNEGGGTQLWQQIALLTTEDGSSNAADFDALGRRSLATDDDKLLIGAPHANSGAGAVAVFGFRESTQTWAFETLLTAPGLEAGDGFGWSVDINGNTAVIGTKAGNEAFVFRESLGWSLQTTLLPSDGRAGGFGQSVATDGSVIVIGAPGEEGLDTDTTMTSGAVYIFERDSNIWDLSVRLDAPQSAVDSEFGHAVAVHSSSVIVGAWLDDDMGAASGSVFTIGRQNKMWSVEAKFTPTEQSPGARFGHDISASGSRASAVALGTDNGSVSPWAQVLRRRGDRWSLEATLAPNDGAGTTFNWRSIVMDGDRVVLGSDAGNGAAVVFRKAEGTDTWTLEATITPSSEPGARLIGYDVALHDETVLLGGLLAPGMVDGGDAVGVSAGAWVMRGTDDQSGDDGAGHDHNDDHGNDDSNHDHNDDHGNDDSNHDHNDDHGNDDSNHDHNDDHGNDDSNHDHNDDHGNDDSNDDSNHDYNDDHGNDDSSHDHSNDGAGHDHDDDHGSSGNDNGSGGDTNQSRARWIVRSLGTLPNVGVPVSDILTWTDSKDGQTYAAVATEDGLILFTRSADRSTWTSRDLTAELVGGEAVAGDISVFGTRGNKVYIVGYTANGDLVIFRQTGSGTAGSYEWEFRNITETDLAPRGFETPRITGNMVSFVTKWNAFNIAGLDAQGRVRAVWTTPGMGQWRSDDLSASSGAPAMSGRLAVFLTPWGGINLAGTDDAGALNVTWWVPGFDKWVTTDFNALFNGPTLDGDSVSAYTTPWGGLNITGRDERGDLVAYWWVPQFGDNKDDDLWRVSNLSEQIVVSEQPAGTLQGLVTPDGEINLFGTNAVNDVIRYHWEPGNNWKMENLTHTATAI